LHFSNYSMSTKKYPLSTLFGRTTKFLSDDFEKRLKENDIKLSIVEFVLLYRLFSMEDDEISQQNFANLEGKHKSVILRQISGLVDKGLVAKMEDMTDGRKSRIMLTKVGITLLEKLLKIEEEMMNEMTKGLTKAEIETLKKASFTIQQNAAAKLKK
jgi:DNA-binding MarR family transcriptional regulator